MLIQASSKGSLVSVYSGIYTNGNLTESDDLSPFTRRTGIRTRIDNFILPSHQQCEETKSLSTKCPELMKLQRATRETERKT